MDEQTCGRFSLKFGENSGLISLYDHAFSRQYASEENLLGKYVYTTFTQKNYDEYFSEYLYCPIDICKWAEIDVGKINVTAGNPIEKTWEFFGTQLWTKETSESCSYYFQLEPENVSAHVYFGAPENIFMNVEISTEQNSYEIAINYALFSKTPTRLPEAHWILFNPDVDLFSTPFLLGKCGEKINPMQTIQNGSHHIHGQWDGIFFGNGMHVESLDAGILSIGSPNPFPTPLVTPDPENGFYFNLYNNIWGTNWIMWYPYRDEDENILYRFKITFPEYTPPTGLSLLAKILIGVGSGIVLLVIIGIVLYSCRRKKTGFVLLKTSYNTYTKS